MGIIESSTVMVAVLFFYTRYRMSSYELAIERRERMLSDLNEILQDKTISDEAKSVALSMFTKSLVSGYVPRLLMEAIWMMLTNASQTTRTPMTQHERTVLRRLFIDHLIPINILAGIHWYVLGSVVVLVACFFAGAVHLARLETIKQKLSTRLIDSFTSNGLVA